MSEARDFLLTDDDSSWKRSNSDASFFPPELFSKALKPECPKVSEHARVYWDIHEAVEASECPDLDSPLSSPNRDSVSTELDSREGTPTNSGSSEVHIHHVRFHDTNSNQASSPNDDNFCRRQSSPATSFEPEAGKLLSNEGTLLGRYTTAASQGRCRTTTSSTYTHYSSTSSESTQHLRSNSVTSETHSKQTEFALASVRRIRINNSAAYPFGLNSFSNEELSLTDGKTYVPRGVHSEDYDASQTDEESGARVVNVYDRLLSELEECFDAQAQATLTTLSKQQGLLKRLISRVAQPLGFSTEKLPSSTGDDHEDRIIPQLIGKQYVSPNQDESSDHILEDDMTLKDSMSSEERKTVIRSANIMGHLLSIENHLGSGESDDLTHHYEISSDETTIHPTHVPKTFMSFDEVDSDETSHVDPTELGRYMISNSWRCRKDVDMYRAFISAIKPLLGRTEDLCQNMISSGCLRNLVYACRLNDVDTLRHTSMGLVDLAVSGGINGQTEMERQHAVEWLFRLAFHPDDIIQYFACLTSVVLSTNRDLLPSVINSNALEFVRPFVSQHTPDQFARQRLTRVFPCLNGKKINSPLNAEAPMCGLCYIQESRNWIEHLLPALESEFAEARILALFHFAVEAIMRTDAKRQETLLKPEILGKISKNADSLDSVEAQQARLVLRLLNQTLPRQLSPFVSHWTAEDVQYWLSKSDFKNLVTSFNSLSIDGDLLLRLDESAIDKGLTVDNVINRYRLIRLLSRLKIQADYSSVDPTQLAEWLRQASVQAASNNNLTVITKPWHYRSILNNPATNLVQYTYNLVSAGVDRSFLAVVTDTMLAGDCRIHNGVHRARILAAIQDTALTTSNSSVPTNDGTKVQSPTERPFDFFISYRRSTGGPLASLLKAHLCQRGYHVFIDIEQLRGGKFCNSLLRSISCSKNFVLVLSADALDRCLEDEGHKDWIHREIVCALKSKCNIIPVLDSFKWPSEEALPEDIRQIVHYNAVNWSHEYQEACISKIEDFMSSSDS